MCRGEGTDLGPVTMLSYGPTFRPLARLWFRRKYQSDINLLILSRFHQVDSRLSRRNGSFGRSIGGVDTLLLSDECSEMGTEVVSGD